MIIQMNIADSGVSGNASRIIAGLGPSETDPADK